MSLKVAVILPVLLVLPVLPFLSSIRMVVKVVQAALFVLLAVRVSLPLLEVKLQVLHLFPLALSLLPSMQLEEAFSLTTKWS